jgi:aminoglycoside phosphotransferase (APT) family kinase protein
VQVLIYGRARGQAARGKPLLRGHGPAPERDRGQHVDVEPCRVTKSQAHDFLVAKYGPLQEPEPLQGGFWSSAFSFSCAGRELVVRFGPDQDWFEADRAAMAFGSPELPVPEVIEVGRAIGAAYAISVRRRGLNLEDVRPEQRAVAGPMLTSLLVALYQVPKRSDLPVDWHSRPLRGNLTLRGWLQDGLVDDAQRTVPGWRTTPAGQAEARLFEACASRIRDLVEACPERRDLVHGDLLNANVLVAEDATHPTAVFSWKCSLRGDFLFDTAWCTFWSPWHPGIAAADPWSHICQEPSIRHDTEAWTDAGVRHHCYELVIGVTHLSWNASVGDLKALQEVTERLSEVLERGPLQTGA